MLILDTDHYSEFNRETSLGLRLRSRLQTSGDDGFVTIITAGEVMKGWLATIQPHRQADRGVKAYHDFQDSIGLLARWIILPWTTDAADNFDRLRTQKVRIGTMDLRIAAIAMEHPATVLTRNLRDFQHIPNLRVENWLD